MVVHRSDKSSAASSSATGSGSIGRDQAGTAGVTLGPYDTIKPSRMRQQQKQLQRGRSGSNGSGNNGNSVSWTLSNADPICRMGFVIHNKLDSFSDMDDFEKLNCSIKFNITFNTLRSTCI